MQSINQEHIIQAYIKAYNSFDVEGMLLHMDEHVRFENVSNGEVTLATTGKAAFKKQAEQAKQYFTQRQQSITAMSETGNRVEVEIQYNATLAADLPNGLKAGDTLTLQGKSIFIFNDDRIISLTDIG